MRLAPWNRFKASSKLWYFYWPFQDGTSFVDHSCYFSVLCCARLFIDALWSPAGKELTSWLSFVMSYCEFVTFPLVSWVRCGTSLCRFLIFALFLTVISLHAVNLHSTFGRGWSGSNLFAKYTYDKHNWYLKVATILYETLLEHTLATNITHNRISCFKRRK